MVGTARTLSYIYNNIIPLTGSPGRQNAQGGQDIIASGPLWDEIGGVASPNIIRGGVDGLKDFIARGGAVGDMSGSPSQRVTNGTALQAVFNNSVSVGKWLELPPAIYEFEKATGIVVPSPGSGVFNLHLRGDMMGTVLSQFYTTTNGGPILVVGDVTTVQEIQGLDIKGLALRFGTAVTGKTSAVPIVLGFMTNSNVDNINIMGDGNPGYDAAQMQGMCFSNEFRTWRIWGWQRTGYYVGSTAGGSTGNKHSNWYMTPGGGPPNNFGTMSGYYIYIDSHVSDMLFSRLNTEWGATNAVLRCGQAFVMEGVSFQEWHLEGIRLTGANPSIIQSASSMLRVMGMNLTADLRAANLTGNASLISDWMGGGSTFIIDGLNMVQLLSPSSDVTFYLLAPYSLSNSSTILEMRATRFDDAGTGQIKGRLQFDQHLAPSANVTVQKFSRYMFGIKGSKIEGAVLQVSGAYSHYGQYDDAVINLAPTGTYTVNLMHTMGATGTQLPRTGNTVTILRETYTSGTVTINTNGTLVVNNTSTTPVFCQFTGSVWATYTPVT